MDKHKLILPISILLGCIILGGFYYAGEINKQKSIERQQQAELQEERWAEEKKLDYAILDDRLERINAINDNLEGYILNIMQLGGVGSRITQATAWKTEEHGYLTPDEFDKHFFNSTGEILYISCVDGFAPVNCSDDLNNKFNKDNLGNCIFPIKEKYKNNYNVECAKK